MEQVGPLPISENQVACDNHLSALLQEVMRDWGEMEPQFWCTKKHGAAVSLGLLSYRKWAPAHIIFRVIEEDCHRLLVFTWCVTLAYDLLHPWYFPVFILNSMSRFHQYAVFGAVGVGLAAMIDQRYLTVGYFIGYVWTYGKFEDILLESRCDGMYMYTDSATVFWLCTICICNVTFLFHVSCCDYPPRDHMPVVPPC